MKSPRQYKSMVTLSYSCALLIYFGVGVCGYLMYGRDAKDEITKNIKGNSSDKHWMSIVNILALILIVINPITKYSLMIIPITFDFTKRISGRASAGHYKRKFLTIGIRTLVSALVLVAALVFPRFDVVMNFMGSLLSFTVSLTFPCVCYLKLYFSELGMLSKLFHCSLALFGAFMSLAGSIWSIIPHKIT
jgi:amino acid permease